MLTFIIAFVVAAVAAYFSYNAGNGEHWGYAILAFLAGMLAVLVPINLYIRKKMNAVFTGIQNELMEAQNRLRVKANAMVNKGITGSKAMAQLEAEQAEAYRHAMLPLDGIRKFQLWNPLAQKQADMLKGQLLYQLKDYDAARPVLEKVMVLDPMILCMKMVLQWKKDPEDLAAIEKLFKKHISRFKYEKGTIVYALYSWILVKQNKLTEAVTLLDEAKSKTEDPVISQNWEHLANKRLTRFSNAGLGEQWYALGLEQPAPVRMTQQDRFGGRPRGGFRR